MVTGSLVPIQITAVNDTDVTQVILTSDLIVFSWILDVPLCLAQLSTGFTFSLSFLLGGFNGTSVKTSAKSMSCQKRFHMGTDQWASLLTQCIDSCSGKAHSKHEVGSDLAAVHTNRQTAIDIDAASLDQLSPQVHTCCGSTTTGRC